jgi:GNAT superfamily N-acetyltransferase
MKVRLFTEADLAPMIALGARMHKESAFAALPYSPSKLTDLGHQALTRPDVIGSWVAISEKDELAGMIVVAKTEFYFNTVPYCTDLLFYIAPEYRGSSAAMRLLAFAREWARQQSCVQMRFGDTALINSEAVHRLYTRNGFKPGGTLFVADLVT